MDEQKLRLRKIRKVRKILAGGESPDRDAQFKHIAALIQQYESAGNLYSSIDTKAKESSFHTASLIRFAIAGM